MTPEILSAAAPEHRDEFAEILAKHVETTPDGRVLVKNEAGTVRYHSHRPGCPEWTVSDYVDHLRECRPEIFGGPKPKTADPVAPMTLTQAMIEAKRGNTHPIQTFLPNAKF